MYELLSSKSSSLKQGFICKQLAGVNRPIALAQANAILSRIDLLCEVHANLMIIFSCKFISVFVIRSSNNILPFLEILYANGSQIEFVLYYIESQGMRIL